MTQKNKIIKAMVEESANRWREYQYNKLTPVDFYFSNYNLTASKTSAPQLVKVLEELTTYVPLGKKDLRYYKRLIQFLKAPEKLTPEQIKEGNQITKLLVRRINYFVKYLDRFSSSLDEQKP